MTRRNQKGRKKTKLGAEGEEDGGIVVVAEVAVEEGVEEFRDMHGKTPPGELSA